MSRHRSPKGGEGVVVSGCTRQDVFPSSIDEPNTSRLGYAKTGTRSSPMDKTNEPDADELAQRIQNRAAGRIGELIKDANEVTHNELWNKLWGNGVTEDGYVVAVDPEDMKSAC